MNLLKVLKYSFTFIGIILLLSAGFWYKQISKFQDTAVTTQGEVIKLVEEEDDEDGIYYKPKIKFTTTTGRIVSFISLSGSNPPAYSEGQKIPILYDPKAPENAKIKSFFAIWFGPLLVTILGLIFSAIGISSWIYLFKKAQNIAFLQKNGKKIKAKFKSVDLNSAIEVNDENPFVVVCQWQNPEDEKIYLFKSENIWYDPTEYVKEKEFDVLIEKGNPANYLVDISFLPKIA